MVLIKAHLLRNQLYASLKCLPYRINASKGEVCLITCRQVYIKIYSYFTANVARVLQKEEPVNIIWGNKNFLF